MMSLSFFFHADVVQAFNSTSRYLEDLLNIDNPYFEQMVSHINEGCPSKWWTFVTTQDCVPVTI